MPSTLPPARALRVLLRTPATTNQQAQAIVRAMHTVAATCRAQADGGDTTPDEHKPLLLQELVELGPQLEGLAQATLAEVANLGSTKRAALLPQQYAALYLLSLLAPAFEPPPQRQRLASAFGSLARGTGAVLAASAATLAAPAQPGEPPEQLAALLHCAVLQHLEQLDRIATTCRDMDIFIFRMPAASQALAVDALNDSSGLHWVATATAILVRGSGSGGSGSGSGSTPAVDLLLADKVAHLLTNPQATALQRATRADRQLQAQLLQLLLPPLVSPLTPAQQYRLRPAAPSTCVAALLELAPDALAVHMATPAGLRSLQAAAQQLQQLQQELRERQRERRLQQRHAAAACPPAPEGQQLEDTSSKDSSNDYETALQPLARVRLFAALAAAALHAPSGGSERAAVVCRLVVDTLPAVAAAVGDGADALPRMSRLNHRVWSHAGQALHALGHALHAAAANVAPLNLRGGDSATAALLAALQLRALLSALDDGWRTWRQQLQGGTPADPAVLQSLACAAEAAEAYCGSVASKLRRLFAHETEQGRETAAGQPGQAATPPAATGAAAPDASRQLAALARVHASCASLLHLLTAEGSEQWVGDEEAGLVSALDALHDAAVLRWEALCRSGHLPAAEHSHMDALVLAHLAALQLGQQACPDQYCAADAAALSWACPSYCLAIAAAAGAAAVVELAKNRQKQFFNGESLAPVPPLLAALRAEERRQAKLGPKQAAALALRIESAKALRPCASLACPHLAANPQLRGKTCSACRTVRYCCAEDQAHDWREGGHRAVCRLLRGASGSGNGGGGGSG